MSAVAIQASVPYYSEAAAYWDELTVQCRRHIEAINAVVTNNNLPDEQGVKWRASSSNMSLNRQLFPSTEIQLRLVFEQWGPKITVLVRGQQDESLRFYPEELEAAIGADADGRIVAITSEGRDLSPHELAKYVTQSFRRCYPGLSLPCPDGPLR